MTEPYYWERMALSRGNDVSRLQDENKRLRDALDGLLRACSGLPDAISEARADSELTREKQP